MVNQRYMKEAMLTDPVLNAHASHGLDINLTVGCECIVVHRNRLALASTLNPDMLLSV